MNHIAIALADVLKRGLHTLEEVLDAGVQAVVCAFGQPVRPVSGDANAKRQSRLGRMQFGHAFVLRE